MPQFSRARYKRCLRSWLSAAGIKLECEANAIFKDLDEATVNASVGNEDKLALSVVRTAVRKLAEKTATLTEEE